MEEIMRDNIAMKKQMNYLTKSQAEYANQNKYLNCSIDNMRGLTASLMKDLQLSKRRENKEIRLLQHFQVDKLLFESEPPIDLYSQYNKLN